MGRIVAVTLAAAAAAAATGTSLIPAQASAITPGRTSFQILMNGDPVGTHSVTVTGSGDTASVRVAIDMAGRVGPIRFTYAHRCEETWRRGALQSLSCTDRENNRNSSVTVSLAGAALSVNGTGFRGEAPATTLPSSWWNAGTVRRTGRVLDTRDGRLIRLSATRVGEAQVAGQRATHWRLRGGVDKDIWYDDAGRWVKSTFRLAGQAFEYRLTTPVSAAPRA
jgi:hypothetical protein